MKHRLRNLNPHKAKMSLNHLEIKILTTIHEFMDIRAFKFCHFFQFFFLNYCSGGKWYTILCWIQNNFPFFCKLPHFGSIPFWNSEKSKGGPFGEKNMKKIDFYVWYLKRTALKNVDWQWNRFLKILIFGEVMDQKVPKWIF